MNKDNLEWLSRNNLTPQDSFAIEVLNYRNLAENEPESIYFNVVKAQKGDMDTIRKYAIRYNRRFMVGYAKEEFMGYLDWVYQNGVFYMVYDARHKLVCVLPAAIASIDCAFSNECSAVKHHLAALHIGFPMCNDSHEVYCHALIVLMSKVFNGFTSDDIGAVPVVLYYVENDNVAYDACKDIVYPSEIKRSTPLGSLTHRFCLFRNENKEVDVDKCMCEFDKRMRNLIDISESWFKEAVFMV